MAKVDVVMPKLGESITEGTIVKWSKSVGDEIKKDETLLEISTDKVDSEIPSPVEGRLAEVLVQETETVEVGTVIARVETDSEAPIDPSAPSSAPASEEEAAEDSKREDKEEKDLDTKRIEKRETRTMRRGSLEKKEGEIDRSNFFSPLVMNIAQKEEVSMEELQQISGSGRGGRVTKNDILNYIEERDEAPAKAPSKDKREKVVAREHERAVEKGTYDEEGIQVIPASPVRKKIAMHMRQSLDTSAHVYSVAECDVTSVMNMIDKKRPQFRKEEGFKLTFNPFILYAVAKALRDYPLVNSSFEDDKIIKKKFINLGMAVATERGLLVPVIKNAGEKNFRGIARSAYDLAIRTRDNKLKVEDIEGSTFSVTNPGVFGNIFGLPIINQPNVAILGVGAIKKRPVVIETDQGDTIGIRSMVYLSLSFDHRLIDGDVGGKFLQQVVEYLEDFSESDI